MSSDEAAEIALNQPVVEDETNVTKRKRDEEEAESKEVNGETEELAKKAKAGEEESAGMV